MEGMQYCSLPFEFIKYAVSSQIEKIKKITKVITG